MTVLLILIEKLERLYNKLYLNTGKEIICISQPIDKKMELLLMLFQLFQEFINIQIRK